jgi:hypothetical protein
LLGFSKGIGLRKFWTREGMYNWGIVKILEINAKKYIHSEPQKMTETLVWISIISQGVGSVCLVLWK